jgi:hypothetical protein
MQRTSQSIANTALMFARSVETSETSDLLKVVDDYIRDYHDWRAGASWYDLVKKVEEYSEKYHKIAICECDAELIGLYEQAAAQASRDCALIAASAAVLLGKGMRNDGLESSAKIYARSAQFYVRKSQGLSTADMGTIE